ncbi:MAG: class II aldolase/adducin family protein [Cyanobacteria bacterium P01_E01_bin.35]
MIDEGYIKYQCRWQQVSAVSDAEIVELNRYRTKLYKLGLIGVYDNGIGFGNLSIRLPEAAQLIISGTQTGGIVNLKAQHYAKVIDYNWQENYVLCQGLIKASSETLTHAAIYAALPQVNAVIHIHNYQLWQQLRDVAPTTNAECAYGTPEMAGEIVHLCQQKLTQQHQIIVMSGHEAGILTFGHNLAEASDILLDYFSAI